jgi:hypothetical protein
MLTDAEMEDWSMPLICDIHSVFANWASFASAFRVA